ncbi:CDP-diacylglycerol--glycerol-3-phosphate 3-phosphatidyltransferase [Cryobacterium roopkundense]|uniref:CDP-diacylglycerol--glycerol-3-phosphate 3-phosphatidyltransferase n=1 Tax=Cryobacterium roopkundense TaxID=1001240 RepID=A0A099JXH1_9MICO|nr:CDP-alcohol phosphatidyltransferase family protein [Cryobacterium roopkundense]KGJ82866.1 CDP-diacylglycerol--glycerol-3-phosphate 3-phosphatidyltransferase [Cryobacterium roopkundense]MBB5640855.1 cardiolipin synthase [Cryobacterium roopkundense]
MTRAESTEVGSQVMTVPNGLSAIRLLLVPVFLILLAQGSDALALIVLAFSSLTDFLDGFIARRFHLVTRLGQLLDPAADRLYIFAALIGLAWRDLVPWWIVLLVVGRDVFLLVLGIILANFGFGPLPVHTLGKVATFCLFYALPMIMLGQAFPDLAWWSQPVGWAFALWGVFLYWWAGIIYATETMRVIRIPRVIVPVQSDTLES